MSTANAKEATTNEAARVLPPTKTVKIQYVKGDATAPIATSSNNSDNKHAMIIVHVCNDIGRWGKGFVMAVSRRWKAPEQAYREWYAQLQQDRKSTTPWKNHPSSISTIRSNGDSNSKNRSNSITSGTFEMGAVQHVRVEDNMWVANIIGQRGIAMSSNKNNHSHTTKRIPPIRYDAIRRGLQKVAQHANVLGGATVHMPRIGCGLAGGTWDDIEPLIVRELSELGIAVWVYDYVVQEHPRSNARNTNTPSSNKRRRQPQDFFAPR